MPLLVFRGPQPSRVSRRKLRRVRLLMRVWRNMVDRDLRLNHHIASILPSLSPSSSNLKHRRNHLDLGLPLSLRINNRSGPLPSTKAMPLPRTLSQRGPSPSSRIATTFPRTLSLLVAMRRLDLASK